MFLPFECEDKSENKWVTWSFHLFVVPSNQQFLAPSASSQTDDITNHYRTKNKLIDDRTREWTQRQSLFGPTTAAHLQSVSGPQLHIRYTLITSDGSSVFLIPSSGCEVTRWHPEAAGLNLTSCKWPTLLSVYINILYTLHPCYIQKEIEIQPTAKVTFMSCLCCVGTSSPGLLRHQKNHTTKRSEVENRAPNPSTTTEPHTTRPPLGPWKLNRTAYRRIKTTSINSCIYTGTNHLRIGSEPCLSLPSFWRRVFVLIYILFKPSSRPDRGVLKVQVHDEGRSTKTEEGLSHRNTVRTTENLLQQVRESKLWKLISSDLNIQQPATPNHHFTLIITCDHVQQVQGATHRHSYQYRFKQSKWDKCWFFAS